MSNRTKACNSCPLDGSCSLQEFGDAHTCGSNFAKEESESDNSE